MLRTLMMVMMVTPRIAIVFPIVVQVVRFVAKYCMCDSANKEKVTTQSEYWEHFW